MAGETYSFDTIFSGFEKYCKVLAQIPFSFTIASSSSALRYLLLQPEKNKTG